MERASRIAAALPVAFVLAFAPLAAAQDEVTIYRCVDDSGQVSIGNLPCPDGQRQEARNMVRPVDGAPSVAPARPPAPAAGPVVQYVAAPPPQPLYQCVRDDGTTYENDTGIGEERRVPVWGGGWPVGGDHRHGVHPGRHASAGRGDTAARGATVRAGDGLSAPPVSRISIPSDPPRPDPDAALGRPRPRPPHGGAWQGTVVERDPCHALPPAETCARLHDRREDIRRRFFNAQQVERDTLRVEERGLNARIDRDCRTY